MPKWNKKSDLLDVEVSLSNEGSNDEEADLSDNSLYCGSFIDDETQSVQSLSPYLRILEESLEEPSAVMESPRSPLLLQTITPDLSRSSPSHSQMGSLDLAEVERYLSPTDSPQSSSTIVRPPALLEPAATFRCTVRKILCTYPKCGKLDELEKALLSKWGPVGCADAKMEAYILSREKHADGSFHLHMGILFTKDVTIRGTSINRLIGSNANVIKGKNGRFDWINIVKYVAGAVSKKVGQYHEVKMYPHTLLETVLAKEAVLVARKERVGSAKMALDSLLAGKTLYDTVTSCPTLALQVGSIQRLQAVIQAQIFETASAPKFQLISVDPRIAPHGATLSRWITSNLLSPTTRALRDPALYITGPPAIGKTSLIQTLSQCCRIYVMTPEKHYVDSWEDNKYDIVVFDEFLGQWPITFMNQFIDGSAMRIQRKCLPSMMKLHNVPVIVLSNAPLDAHYPHAPPIVRQAFQSRFDVVDMLDLLPGKYLSDFIHIDMIPK